MTPYKEHHTVEQAAHACGLDVMTRVVMRIDVKALPEQYFKRVPDYKKIRTAILAGAVIPGAEIGDGVEYVLRRMDTGEPQCELS